MLLWLYCSPTPSTHVSKTMDYFIRPALHSQILDHLSKPLCPRFNKYDRQKLLLLEPNECTPLLTEHPDFSADLCFSPYTCNEGLVRVRRRDRALCRTANLKYPISGNATHDAFHRQFSGPDAFHVVFSGSEKLSPPDWYHAGQCLYVFPFHISNPGKLTLDITHLYDNFGAVVEEADSWPVLQRKKVVSNLPLEICRGCPSRVAEPRFEQPSPQPSSSSPASESRSESHEGSETVPIAGAIARNLYQAYSAGRTSSSSSLSSSDQQQLPLCSKDLAVQGVWLPAHPVDKQSWRKANYTWTPLGCTFGEPLDLACLERKKDAKTKKVLFQGDTHLRVAIEHLLERLHGSTTLQNTTTTSAEKMEEIFGSTTLTYMHDPMFSQIGEKSDILVGNMGHAATGTKFLDQLWSTSKYHDKLRDLVDRVLQRARDLQDLEDEDDDHGGRFLDGDEYDTDEEEADEIHDYYEEEDDEDEDELEMEREMLRQEKQKPAANSITESIEVFWGDETEEEVISVSEKELHQLEEQEEEERLRREQEQEERDEMEDRYRVSDRYRAEQEGYEGSPGSRYRDPAERAHPRYPNNRILRQSKYHKATPNNSKNTPKDDGVEADNHDNSSGDNKDSRSRPLYRHTTQKKVALSGDKKMLAKKPSFSSNRGNRANNNNNVKLMAGQNIEGTMKGLRSSSNLSNAARTGSDASAEPRRKNQEDFREPYAYSNRRTVRPIDPARSGGADKAKTNKGEDNSDVGSKDSRNTGDTSTTGYRMLHKRQFSADSGYHDHKDQELPLKVVWAGMVAYPESQPVSDPMFSHDWRSIYRLRYWNQIAEEVMLLHNVRFMDFFSMTLSMLDTSPDHGHYFGTDAAEAMLEELSYKIGLCDDDEGVSEDAIEQ
ncbi:hypothetical protein BGZ83_009322 [Gryganskiella cystojenkinii]|nr:hypothetical protein BGZ83_009322 [Gryganskiella cystojenkinii]